jgi:hypothetical protein
MPMNGGDEFVADPDVWAWLQETTQGYATPADAALSRYPADARILYVKFRKQNDERHDQT